MKINVMYLIKVYTRDSGIIKHRVLIQETSLFLAYWFYFRYFFHIIILMF